MFAKDLLFDDDDDVSVSTSDHFCGSGRDDRDDISLTLQLSTSCRDEKAAAIGRGRPKKRRGQLDISPDIIIEVHRFIQWHLFTRRIERVELSDSVLVILPL